MESIWQRLRPALFVLTIFFLFYALSVVFPISIRCYSFEDSVKEEMKYYSSEKQLRHNILRIAEDRGIRVGKIHIIEARGVSLQGLTVEFDYSVQISSHLETTYWNRHFKGSPRVNVKGPNNSFNRTPPRPLAALGPCGAPVNSSVGRRLTRLVTL